MKKGLMLLMGGLLVGLLMGCGTDQSTPIQSPVQTNYTFSWIASPSGDVVGYRLYEDGIKVADIGNTTSHTYNRPPGIHTYAATAINGAGKESIFSNEIQR